MTRDEQVDARLRERGASAVEFAILVPVLVLILFGIIYFSLYFNARQGVQAAAREGARLASLSSTTGAEACAKAKGALTGVPVDNVSVQVSATAPSGSSDVCSTTASVCAGSASSVYVRVAGTVTVSIPFWPGSGVLTAASTANFQCE
jgi:Flp pilus assembly protein TadG